jgi:hypothetical protein
VPQYVYPRVEPTLTDRVAKFTINTPKLPLNTPRRRQVAIAGFDCALGDRTRSNQLGFAQFRPSSPLARQDDNRNYNLGCFVLESCMHETEIEPNGTVLHTLYASPTADRIGEYCTRRSESEERAPGRRYSTVHTVLQ